MRLAALAVLATLLRYWRFAWTPYAVGTDGYYYAVQVRSFWHCGAFNVPDGSWVLRAIALLARAAPDWVSGVKAAASLEAGLCVVAAYGGMRWLGASERRAWLLAALVALSPGLTTLAGEFPKNLGMVPCWWLACALGFSARPRLALAAGCAALAALAHRAGLAFVAASLLGAVLSRRARGDGWILASVAAASVAAALLLPNTLHPGDAWRLTWVAPWHAALPPFSYFSLRPFSLAERCELLLVWPALLTAVWLWWQRRAERALIAALAAPLLLVLAPVWPAGTLEVGLRWCLLAPMVAWPLLVLAVPERWLRRPLLIAASVAAPLCTWVALPLPPYAAYDRLIAALPAPLPEMLIAHQGLAFYYEYRTGHHAMSWAPDARLAGLRVGRLAWGIDAGEWEHAGPVVALSPSYAYVDEPTWQALVAQARAAGDDDLVSRIDDWHNPSLPRPPGLLRNYAAASAAGAGECQ